MNPEAFVEGGRRVDPQTVKPWTATDEAARLRDIAAQMGVSADEAAAKLKGNLSPPSETGEPR